MQTGTLKEGNVHKTVNTKRSRLTPDARAAQLLETALILFAQRGLGRVGHGDIAKAAHVSTGTVFNYFSTIDDLNEAVMDVVREMTLSIFVDEIAPSESPVLVYSCLLYTSPSPRDQRGSRMPSSA